jgi:hypothetical protein
MVRRCGCKAAAAVVALATMVSSDCSSRYCFLGCDWISRSTSGSMVCRLPVATQPSAYDAAPLISSESESSAPITVLCTSAELRSTRRPSSPSDSSAAILLGTGPPRTVDTSLATVAACSAGAAATSMAVTLPSCENVCAFTSSALRAATILSSAPVSAAKLTPALLLDTISPKKSSSGWLL